VEPSLPIRHDAHIIDSNPKWALLLPWDSLVDSRFLERATASRFRLQVTEIP
jgi:hypothetical protein